VREDCGKDGQQIKASGPCKLFPELHVEFDPGKPPILTLHQEEDQTIDLSPLQRREIIDLFVLRDFIQAAPLPQLHEEEL